MYKIEGELLNPVSEATGISRAVLEELTMASLVGYLWNEIQAKGARRWVLPTVEKLRKSRRFGQQICPGCLHDDAVPYIRKSWRLAFHVVCPLHRTPLLDRCQSCCAPILLERLDVGMPVPNSRAVVYRCWRCGDDFRGARLGCDMNDELIAHQAVLLDCLRRGWIKIGDRVVYSTQFFDGLWILWSFLDKWLNGNCIYAKSDIKKCPTKLGYRTPVSHLEIYQRRLILEMAGKYIDDWPSRLLNELSSTNISGGDVLRFHNARYGKDIPYWLWGPIHLNMNGATYSPSNGEISEAIRFILIRDGFIRCSEVALILNMQSRSNSRIRAFCKAALGSDVPARERKLARVD